MKFKIPLFFVLFISLFSCQNESRSLSFHETNFNLEGNNLVKITLPLAEGKKEVSQNINQTLEHFISVLLHIGDPDKVTTSSIDKSISDFNTEYTTFISDFPESSMAWEADITGEVIYQTPEVICISIDSYVFTGGAHGMSSISFFNFNPKTGAELKTADLITNMEAFTAVAETYFQKQVIETDKILFEDMGFTMPEQLGFDEKGVLFLYNPYDIAPYATGMIEFRIPYEEVSDYLSF